MFHKYLLIPALLSLVGVLVLADSAHAQWRGGFGRLGARNTYGAPYFGGSYGNSNYSPYGTGRYYSNPRTSYYQPSTEYYTPSTEYYAPSSQPINNSANIRVIVNQQARVWFDGNPTQQVGAERVFTSPSLQAGYSYTYRIRATWTQGGREMTQERVVSVSPGATALVDFTQQSTEALQAKPLQSELLDGRVIRTGEDHFVVETGDNRQITVYTNPQTRFSIDNRAGAFPDLRVGSNVSTGYSVKGGRHLANTVTIAVPKK